MGERNDLIERLDYAASQWLENGEDESGELAQDAADALLEAATTIASLSEALAEAEKKLSAREISPKGGDVLQAVVLAIPKDRTWTTKEVECAVVSQLPTTTSKEIYSAIGYLARKGRITRLGYGRYASPFQDAHEGGRP